MNINLIHRKQSRKNILQAGLLQFKEPKLTDSANFFETIEASLLTTLKVFDEAFSTAAKDDVGMFIDHGEYGCAWELMEFVFEEAKMRPDAGFIKAGTDMGFDISEIALLKPKSTI